MSILKFVCLFVSLFSFQEFSCASALLIEHKLLRNKVEKMSENIKDLALKQSENMWSTLKTKKL